jgi:hypothetical protein
MYLRGLLGRCGGWSWYRSRRRHQNRRGCFGRSLLADRPEMLAYLVCNIVLDRTGVRPLVGDPQFKKVVEYRLAFDLQLARQIVDPNLAHFPSFFAPSHNRGQG